MVEFNVTLEGSEPIINVSVPLGEYLLDDEKVEEAKEIIQGVSNLCFRSETSRLIINGESGGSYNLKDIVERHRSLYLIKLLDDVVNRVKPLSDPHITEIAEKIEPMIKRSKEELKRGGHYGY